MQLKTIPEALGWQNEFISSTNPKQYQWFLINKLCVLQHTHFHHYTTHISCGFLYRQTKRKSQENQSLREREGAVAKLKQQLVKWMVISKILKIPTGRDKAKLEKPDSTLSFFFGVMKSPRLFDELSRERTSSSIILTMQERPELDRKLLR